MLPKLSFNPNIYLVQHISDYGKKTLTEDGFREYYVLYCLELNKENQHKNHIKPISIVLYCFCVAFHCLSSLFSSSHLSVF